MDIHEFDKAKDLHNSIKKAFPEMAEDQIIELMKYWQLRNIHLDLDKIYRDGIVYGHELS